MGLKIPFLDWIRRKVFEAGLAGLEDLAEAVTVGDGDQGPGAQRLVLRLEVVRPPEALPPPEPAAEKAGSAEAELPNNYHNGHNPLSRVKGKGDKKKGKTHHEHD